jgi:pyridoxal phosphate enzyme (YggS family)
MVEPALAERLAVVQSRIADAARAASRDPAGITAVVITKFHPASLVRELSELGVHDFGESRHQEAAPKIASLTDLGATWHFIGQLQSKKARQVREYTDVLHSLDRESLVDVLEGGSKPLDVFIQVNLTDDLARGGVSSAELEHLAERAAGVAGLTVVGLMTVAPLEAPPREAFATLRRLSERVQLMLPAASGLSMGMSGDFEDAILEGATHLRIGTAITGKRPELR